MGDLNGLVVLIRFAIDVQGWFDRIVTTSTYEFADLFTQMILDKPTQAILVGLRCFSPIVSVISAFNSAILAQEESHGVRNQRVTDSKTVVPSLF